MKTCPKCNAEVLDPRKKFCSDSCKYWFNLIKRENESHLPPSKKRNKNFFKMAVGSERANKGTGQGRRSGSMVLGSMSDMFIRVRVDEFAEVNKENIIRHLKGIPGYMPNGIELCDDQKTYIRKEDILKVLGIDINE